MTAAHNEKMCPACVKFRKLLAKHKQKRSVERIRAQWNDHLRQVERRSDK